MLQPAQERWLATQAILWTLFLIGAAWAVGSVNFFPIVLLSFSGLALASYAVLLRILRPAWHVADIVTVARFVGLLTTAIWVAANGRVSWPIWAAMLTIVLLDLADGWCARRYGGSEQGATLDMETDQFTTSGLALIVAGAPGIGPWILFLPGLKYLFVLLMHARNIPAHDPKPVEGNNLRGRVICAAVMTLLLTCALPVASTWVRTACSAVAVFALAYSFSADARHLFGKRPGASSGSQS